MLFIITVDLHFLSNLILDDILSIVKENFDDKVNNVKQIDIIIQQRIVRWMIKKLLKYSKTAIWNSKLPQSFVLKCKQ